MSPGVQTALRTVTFADSAAGVWGATLAAEPRPPLLIVGAAARTAALDAELEGTDPEAEWRIAGDGLELTIAAAETPVAGAGDASGQRGFDQLCRVAGQLTIAGAEYDVAGLGVRGARDGALDAGAFHAVRGVAAWFEPADGLALAAFRPDGAKGQDADVISAAVLDPEAAAPVDDPRLSTTYTADGWPARAGLELWLAGDEDQHLLRRAAGEATGARGSAVAGGLELRAELFRWHSGGREGAGVYLLASRR